MPETSEMVPAARIYLLKACFSEFGEKEVKMGVEVHTAIDMRVDHLFFP